MSTHQDIRIDIQAHGMPKDLDLPDSDNTFADQAEVFSASIPESLAGERMDKILAQLFSNFSRSQLAICCDLHRVTQNGSFVTRRTKTIAGALIELQPLSDPMQQAYSPEAIDLDVLFEDAYLLVLNKPSGLVVHPAAGNWHGTLLNGLLHHYPANVALPRAGIVHRLDRDTTGLMVVSRNTQTQLKLVRLLQERTIKREYIAFVWGVFAQKETTVETYIGRDTYNRTRMKVYAHGAEHGKLAITHFTLLQTLQWQGVAISALHCQLETGRTHQIRVHLQHLGLPMLQDMVYGRVQSDIPVLKRQALHAFSLKFQHPISEAPLTFHAALPEDMQQCWQSLGGKALFNTKALHEKIIPKTTSGSETL